MLFNCLNSSLNLIKLFMKTKLLFGMVILAFCVCNTLVLFNTVPGKMANLNLSQLIALAWDEGSEGGGGGGGGTCTGRGGSEMPKQVLQLVSCRKKVQIGTTITWENGNKCSCENPPRGYQGILGCNLSWETDCK